MAKEHTWIMVSFLCHFAQHVVMQPTFVLNATILSCSVPYLLTLTNCQKSRYFSSKLSAQKMILWNTIQYYSCIFDFSLGFLIRIFVHICPLLFNSSPKEYITGTFSEAHLFLNFCFLLKYREKESHTKFDSANNHTIYSETPVFETQRGGGECGSLCSKVCKMGNL